MAVAVVLRGGGRGRRERYADIEVALRVERVERNGGGIRDYVRPVLVQQGAQNAVCDARRGRCVARHLSRGVATAVRGRNARDGDCGGEVKVRAACGRGTCPFGVFLRAPSTMVTANPLHHRHHCICDRLVLH